MTEQHVPVERLAAYAAGDLDATASVEVEAHVALCAECRSDVDAVRRATGALAGLPPVTMPRDVAARVDAAVAAARSGSAGPVGPVGDVLPMAGRRKPRPSFAGIAAVAACFALVAAVGVPLVTGGGGASETAADRSTAAGSAPEGNVQTRRLESGLNYTAETIGQTITRALGGGTDAALASRDTEGSAPFAASPPPTARLSGSQPKTTSSGEAAPDALTLTSRELRVLQSDPGRLGACVASLAESQPRGLGTTPLLVDFARYAGKPALVVVFPTVTRGEVTRDRADVWVVGPRCGVTPGDDHVLVFERIDRPAGL